jgi:PST family polysaccharide transporter
MIDPAPPSVQSNDSGDVSALKRSTVRGIAFTYASQAMRMVIQFASVIVLSRLLNPAEFGLYAMVTPVYGLVLLAQDFGLTQTTIQRFAISRGQISALFWINVTVGLGLALLLVALAPAVASFYGDPRCAMLTRGFAGVIAVSAISAQPLALINRAMRFRYLAILDALAFSIGVGGALLLGFITRSYWALFAIPAITTIVTAIGAWAGAGFVPDRPRRESQMGELLRLGGGFTGFNICNFVARNLDNVLIGRADGQSALGLYDRAYKLLLFPLQQINQPLARVMMPTLSRLQNDPVRYRTTYRRAAQQLLILSQPGIVFAIATAPILVPTLLGSQWRGAAPIFQWLGLAALQQALSASTTWLFISQGRSGEYLTWGVFNAVTSGAAFLAGLPWGPLGVAAAYSVSQICLRMPVMWWMATRKGPVRLGDLLAIATPHAAASAVAFAAVIAFGQTANLGPHGTLTASLVVAYAASLLTLAAIPAGRAMLRDGLTLLATLQAR